MSRVKIMTDEELADHIEKIMAITRDLREMWRTMMKQAPLRSTRYRMLCSTANSAQKLQTHLVSEYENRHDSIQKTRERFGEGVYSYTLFD